MRQRNGARLPAEVSGALGAIARDARRGQLRLEAVERYFPAFSAQVAEYEAHPERLDLQQDVIRLTAIRDLLLSGEIETDALFLVRALTTLIDTKANALRTRHYLEQKGAVPVPVMRDYVRRFVGLMGKYVPPERQGELMADLRVMAAQSRAG